MRINLASVLGMFLLLISCEWNDDEKLGGKTINIVELNNNGCSIYLKHVVWGLTGDNSITYLSNTPSLKDTANEPYLRVLDFFYKLDETNCSLLVCKADALKRKNKLKIDVAFLEDRAIDYSNYQKERFENILYH